MHLSKRILGRFNTRRAVSILACVALLYFALGATVLHQHTSGPENACHICQSLHVPALASTALDLAVVPELIARFSSQARHTAPSDSFSLHRASRAPPAR